MGIEIIPAILSYTKEDFEAKVRLVQPYVKRIQIDVMDGKFVRNKTLDPAFFPPIPSGLEAQYHLMVEDPLDFVKKISHKGAIYEVHVEALEDIGSAISQIRKLGGKAALALSPDTPAQAAIPYLGQISHVLVMTVYPGFSGQKYLASMEPKIKELSLAGAKVEIDGGVEVGTVRRAAKAGATMFAAASAIFSKPDPKKAIEELLQDALSAHSSA
ncbi:MAG: ribulose-phosphate 3-epimerase [Candidatus Micrarchaeota archaeon]|nr:ribulose-phosphate 3-epimerase [Candidatus Micrarchaeota archaeon]